MIEGRFVEQTKIGDALKRKQEFEQIIENQVKAFYEEMGLVLAGTIEVEPGTEPRPEFRVRLRIIL